MSEDVKFQEMKNFKSLVDSGLFDKAEQTLSNVKMPKTIKSFNKSYLEYKKGNLVEALAQIDTAKYNGMISEEVRQATEKIKTELGITVFEREYSLTENLMFESKLLPKEFYPTISLILLLMGGLLLIKGKKILSSFLAICFLCVLSFHLFVTGLKAAYNLEERIIYRGPSKIFEEVQVLPAGVKFIYTKESENWKYIEYPRMFKGWVHMSKEIKI